MYKVLFYYMFFFYDPLFFWGGEGGAITVHVDTYMYMIIISLFMHILFALLFYTNSVQSKGNNSKDS